MLLELKGVSKTYGNVEALKDVSFAVDSGEWVSIMGPSGSGKTTLLNIIGCLDKPTYGIIRLDGDDLSSLDAKQLTEVRRDKIGLIFQQFHLIPHLTAVENIMVAQYYHSMPDEKEALASLTRVGLVDRAHHFPSQLSGGENQRVAIARSLATDPSIMLCDEPTGSLDFETGKRILKLLRVLNETRRKTVIIVTHNSPVGAIADRVVRMRDGNVVQVICNAQPLDPEALEW